MKKLYLLQLGLAFVLVYAAIDAFAHPADWIGFVPKWVTEYGITRQMALQAHSILEIILGVWLLSSWKVRVAAVLTALDMLLIIFADGFSRAIFLITFRDVGLFFAAVYLALTVKKYSQ